LTLRRSNPKRDANEPEIKAALERGGAKVWPISGSGKPDLLCLWCGVFFFVECKMPDGKLTTYQETFLAEVAQAGGGPVYVAYGAADIPDILTQVQNLCG